MKLCLTCGESTPRRTKNRKKLGEYQDYCSLDCWNNRGRATNCNRCGSELKPKAKQGYCVPCSILRIYARKFRIPLAELAKKAWPIPLVCEICGEPQIGFKERLSFDHCHKTNKFRGWLCHHCNLGLGYFHDDPKLLRKAAKYLERFGDHPRLAKDVPEVSP